MTPDRKNTRSPEGAAHNTKVVLCGTSHSPEGAAYSTKSILCGTKITPQRELVKT